MCKILSANSGMHNSSCKLLMSTHPSIKNTKEKKGGFCVHRTKPCSLRCIFIYLNVYIVKCFSESLISKAFKLFEYKYMQWGVIIAEIFFFYNQNIDYKKA